MLGIAITRVNRRAVIVSLVMVTRSICSPRFCGYPDMKVLKKKDRKGVRREGNNARRGGKYLSRREIHNPMVTANKTPMRSPWMKIATYTIGRNRVKVYHNGPKHTLIRR
jgi:hypothetical protein